MNLLRGGLPIAVAAGSGTAQGKLETGNWKLCLPPVLNFPHA